MAGTSPAMTRWGVSDTVSEKDDRVPAPLPEPVAIR
jgi:hypothetical protein